VSEEASIAAAEWLARGWRAFDLGAGEAIVVWDPGTRFLATVPRGLEPLLEGAAASDETGLREALDRQR
jgi:hypothetical protein